MFVVDTNILLHAANRDSVEHARARQAVESYLNGSEAWAVTWGIFYEFLRVTTHPRVFPAPLTFDQALGFLNALLDQPNLSVLAETPVHRQVLAQCKDEVHRLAGNLFHDLHTAVIMREHGVDEIVTLDADFKAFPWVTIRGLA